MPTIRVNHAHKPLSAADIEEHFGSTGPGLLRTINAMGQKQLQSVFRAVYGPTFSNNNAWLRRKLLEAVGLHTPKVVGTKGKKVARPERLASTGSSASGAGGDMQRIRPAVRQQARSPETGEVRRTKRLRKPKQYQDMLVEQFAAPATPTVTRARRHQPGSESSPSPERSSSLGVPPSEESSGMPWAHHAGSIQPRYIGHWTAPGHAVSVSCPPDVLLFMAPSTPQGSLTPHSWAATPPEAADFQGGRMHSMPLMHNLPVDERSDSSGSSLESFRYARELYKTRSMPLRQSYCPFPYVFPQAPSVAARPLPSGDARHLAASPPPMMPLAGASGTAESLANSFLLMDEAPVHGRAEPLELFGTEELVDLEPDRPVNVSSSTPLSLPMSGNASAMDVVMRQSLGAGDAMAVSASPTNEMDLDTLDFVKDVMYRFNPSAGPAF